MPLRSAAALLAACALAACSPPAQEAPAQPAPPAQPPAAFPPVEPPAPGTPGGLPDDRTPISEAPFTPQSAQGAANVVQTYFALIEGRQYAEAHALLGGSGGMSAADFARSFDKYYEYHAQIGGPGEIEGAAGSLYVEVPVVVYGRLKTGEEVHENGTATLRRVNGVDGASPEQLRWHIARLDLKPSPRP